MVAGEGVDGPGVPCDCVLAGVDATGAIDEVDCCAGDEYDGRCWTGTTVGG
jgi:hypothetical protein